MTVKDIMTSNVKSCDENTDLATAAKLMWDGDCGIVPVVNDQKRVIGVITDRDICIAASTRAADPATIQVRDAMSRHVRACAQTDDVRSVLTALRDRRVRRLPVVDEQNRLVGVISMNDLVARAEFRRGAELPGEEFLETLKAVSTHATAGVTA